MLPQLSPDQLRRLGRARIFFGIAFAAQLIPAKTGYIASKYSNPHWVSGVSWAEIAARVPLFLLFALLVSFLAYLWPTSPK